MPNEDMPNFEPVENEAPIRPIAWSEIEPCLATFIPAEGGNSNAQRGFVTIGEEKVFVKVGVNEHTKGWASKEINAYDFLAENSYPYIPELLSVNTEHTGFALEALLAERGWDWSNKWNDERLNATLAATDALAAIKPASKYLELLKPVVTDEDNGWAKLIATPELQESLAAKLQNTEASNLMGELRSHFEKSSQFHLRHDTIVHDDIRADNCPWNESLGQVKLVDWNWVELGDRRLDLSAMLVHIHNGGFDVLPNFQNRLDAAALHWMAGVWLHSASKPIWEGGPTKLRETQLASGITALKLAAKIS